MTVFWDKMRILFGRPVFYMPVGFFASLSLLLIALYFLPARYETNDEIAIVRLSSGIGVPPQSSNRLISQTLSYLLYGSFPSIPWYGLILYSTAYLGIFLISSVVFRTSRRDYLASILTLPAFLLYFGYSLFFISFTASSLLLEFGVFLSLLERLVREKSASRFSRYNVYLLSVAFVVSYLLRWKLVLYSVAFGLPLLLFTRKHEFKWMALAFLFITGFIIGDRPYPKSY